MRYLLVVIIMNWSGVLLSQDFISNRITPTLSASSDYSEILNLSEGMAKWDCPPKLKHYPTSHFTFLDSLPLDPQFEEQLLSLFMDNNCTSYYSILTQYIHAKPIYDSILNSVNIDAKYAIIPLTVSGCNPTLKYQGDKSGEWQLSYINARKYGLHITPFEDERNSRTLATLAASSYLKFLNEYYLNNELLVITAFYTSVPYVNKQINALDTVNSVSFFNQLPSELKGYFSYLKSWNNWLEHFKQPKASISKNIFPKWEVVEVKDTLDFQTISKFTEVSELDLHRMNPVLIGKKAFPKSNTALLLPPDKAAHFEETYAEFVAFQKEEKIRKEEELVKLRKQMESGIPDLNTHVAITYKVKSGDVLGKIASKHNVKVSQIKQWNNLNSDRINIGQKLVLYVPKNTKQTTEKEVSENKIETKPKVAQPGKGEPVIYTVKNGDSLWLISQKYPGVSAENIMEWNGCTDKISPGMKLKIYQPNN